MANISLSDGPSGAKPKPFITIERLIVYTVLVVCALFFLFPLYVMIITSLKSIQEIQGGNIFVPTLHPTFDAWEKAWNSACTGLYCEGIKVGFWNSIKITVPSTIVSIAVASVTGYSLANWPFKFSEVFFAVLLLSNFIPYIVMLYPLVIITRELGIYSTLPAVILVHTIFGMPMQTLLFRNYFASLPQELFKAARVDGAGYWGIFFRIFVPMATADLHGVDHPSGHRHLERLSVRRDLRRSDQLSDDGATEQHRQFGTGRQGIQRRHGGHDPDGSGSAGHLLHLWQILRARHCSRRREGLIT